METKKTVNYRDAFPKNGKPQPFQYAIKHTQNGNYVIYQKYVPTGDLTIHSQYDSFKEAIEALKDLRADLSSADAVAYSRYLAKNTK